MHYRTIIISDLHLGIKDSKAKKLSSWLKENTADNIILNGDIIDSISIIKNNNKWKKKHFRFFIRLFKNWEKYKDSKIFYLYGNHDEFLKELIPFQMENFYIQKEMVYHSANGNNYLVTHGDVFDIINKNNLKWISYLGSWGYNFLLYINRIYNYWRIKKGYKYLSLSQKIKQKVKKAVQWISNFEYTLVHIAKERGYDGVICGHIHIPNNKNLNGIHYLNSGDCVESMSLLCEDFKGNWEIVYFNQY